jgi:hypothetical protein
MSFYARQMLNRPGVSFGSHPHHREAAGRHLPSSSSRDGGVDNNDIGGDIDGGGGGISHFTPQQQRDHRWQQRNRRPQRSRPQHRQAAVADQHQEEAIFQVEDAGGDEDYEDDNDDAPIEGSIHAQEMNFSQVTLSQLSDGPSVRSYRSHRTGTSSRERGAAAGVVAGAAAAAATATTRGDRGGGAGHGNGSSLRRGGSRESNRDGGLNLPERRHVFYASTATGGQQQQQQQRPIAQPRRDTGSNYDRENAESLKSSQPLLSQVANRTPSNGGTAAARPASSDDGTCTRWPLSGDVNGKKGGRPSSGGGGEHRTSRQQASSFSRSSRMITSSTRPTTSPPRGRDRNDDDTTVQSQSLLSPMPTSTLPSSIAPRCLDNPLKRRAAKGIMATMTSDCQRQLSFQRGQSGTFDRGQEPRMQSRIPSLLSGLPILRDYGSRAAAAPAANTPRYHHPPFPPSSGRHSSMGGAPAVRMSAGSAMSGTLASHLSTPSRAFRSMTGLAARTLFSPFRVSGLRVVRSKIIGSTLGGPASASSAARGSSSAAAIPRHEAGSTVLASSLALSSAAGDVDCYSGGPRDGQEATDGDRSQESRTALRTGQRIDEQNANSLSMMCDEASHGAQKSQAEESKSLPTGLCDAVASKAIDDRTKNSTHDMAEPRFTADATRDHDRTDICDAACGRLDAVMESNQLHHEGVPENEGIELFPSNDTSQPVPQQQEVDLKLPQLDQNRSSKTIDNEAKHATCENQNYDDDISKGSGSTLDLHGKTEEIIAATRALNHQYEQLEKSKQELIEMNERAKQEFIKMNIAATHELNQQHERLEKSKQEFIEMEEHARQEMKEEYRNLEALQKLMHDKYGTLQSSIDDFSTKISSDTHDQESTIRTLVNTSMNDLRQESIRATEKMKAGLHELIEIEARKYMSEMMEGKVNAAKNDFHAWANGLIDIRRTFMSEMTDGVVDTAKSDFQEWADGVMNTRIVSGDGFARSNHSTSNGDAGTAGGSAVAGGTLEKQYKPADRSMRVPSKYSVWNDTEASNDDDNFSAGSSKVGDRISGKENMHPSHELEPRANQKVKASKPELSDGQNSPLRDKRDVSNKSLTPLTRGTMSTSTTPFSRKATPLQNNYANRRLSSQPSNLLRRGINIESELHNDFTAVNSCDQIDKSPTDVYFSPPHFRPQSAITTRNAESKVKVVKKASPNESKYTVEASTTFAGKTSKGRDNSGLPGQAPSEPDVVQLKSKMKITVALKKDSAVAKDTPETTRSKQMTKVGSHSSPSQGVVEKRVHSEVVNASKSPRRSKRLKEANHVEHMAAQAADPSNADEPKPKPSQVTPRDNATPIVTRKRDDAGASSSSAICSSTSGRADDKKTATEERVSESNGFDTLLGTSVTVPNYDQFEDELVGLDESDDVPPERTSLTYFLPFCGFRNRANMATGSMTMSKKKTMAKKKRRTFPSCDFVDFDFS